MIRLVKIVCWLWLFGALAGLVVYAVDCVFDSAREYAQEGKVLE